VRRKSKAKCQKSHAIRRFRERFGVHISKNDYQAYVRQIQEGNAKFLEKQSNRISVFEIIVQGESVRVCYDKERKSIVTVLPPPDAWSQTSGFVRRIDETED